jgi:hypothetical protein
MEMGQTKALEIKVVAIGLIALAVLASILALSTAVAIGGKLRSQPPKAAATQSTGGSLGLLERP